MNLRIVALCLLAFSLQACNKSTEEPDGQDTNNTQEITVTFNLDGESIDFSSSNPEGADLTFAPGQARSFPADSMIVKQSFTMKLTKDTEPQQSIELVFFFDEPLSNYELKDSIYYRTNIQSFFELFDTLAFSFEANIEDATHHNVVINYNDGSTIWSSYKRTGDSQHDQSTASFSLQQISTNNMSNSYSIYVNSSVSCNLYDNAGNEMVLGNGEFGGVLQEFYLL